MKNQRLMADFPILEAYFLFHNTVVSAANNLFLFHQIPPHCCGKCFCVTTWKIKIPYMDTTPDTKILSFLIYVHNMFHLQPHCKEIMKKKHFKKELFMSKGNERHFRKAINVMYVINYTLKKTLQ